MAERVKPEIASQKKVVKLPPAIGDWTTYRPPKLLVKKVKSGLYGFDRLSRADLDLALKIHYAFVQELLHRLRVDLGLGIEFSAYQIEQTNYLNFLRTLSGAVVQGRLNIAELHDNVQFYLDLDLASSVINHALGSRDQEQLTRGLTEAENQVLTAALTEYLPAYVLAFADSFPLPAFTIVSSPDVTLDPSVSAAATFVVFSAEVSLNDNPLGKIRFGYPGNSLKALLKLCRAQTALRPLDFGRLSAAVLGKIMVPVRAMLGQTYLSTTEIGQLEIGDVVALDLPINSPVALRIGQEIRLPAQPGVRGRKKVVRLAASGGEDVVTSVPPQAAITPPPAPIGEPPAPPPAPPAAVPAELPAEEVLADTGALSDEDFNNEDFNLEDLNLEESSPQ
jgi:flagellar motor switch protein FliM